MARCEVTVVVVVMVVVVVVEVAAAVMAKAPLQKTGWRQPGPRKTIAGAPHSQSASATAASYARSATITAAAVVICTDAVTALVKPALCKPVVLGDDLESDISAPLGLCDHGDLA